MPVDARCQHVRKESDVIGRLSMLVCLYFRVAAPIRVSDGCPMAVRWLFDGCEMPPPGESCCAQPCPPRPICATAGTCALQWTNRCRLRVTPGTDVTGANRYLTVAASSPWDTDRVMTGSLPLVFAASRRAMPPVHLADLDGKERSAAVIGAGQPAFRADQLARHYFGGLTRDPREMTDLPAAGRAEFVDALLPELLTEVRSLACDDAATRKTLWRAHDGTLIESVLMRYPDRITLCVSSQAGCGMACPFCAT